MHAAVANLISLVEPVCRDEYCSIFRDQKAAYIYVVTDNVFISHKTKILGFCKFNSISCTILPENVISNTYEWKFFCWLQLILI